MPVLRVRSGCCSEPGSPFRLLTAREWDVACYLTQGWSSKAIALVLGLSHRTVEAYRARIFQKLQVRNAVELTQRCQDWRARAAVRQASPTRHRAGRGDPTAPGLRRYPADASGGILAAVPGRSAG